VSIFRSDSSSIKHRQSSVYAMTKSIINHVTFSTSGGAGIVARRLQELQVKDSVDSRILSVTDKNIQALKFSNPNLVLRALADFFLVRKDRGNSLFTLLRCKGSLKILRELRSSRALIHLHWTPGAVSTSDVEDFLSDGRIIVWTIHDMWPITAGCHHARDCGGFTNQCSDCPQVRKYWKNRVSNEMKRKQNVFNYGTRLVLVAPSHWMALQIISSNVSKGSQVCVIPNPIDTFTFRPFSKIDSKKLLGIPNQSLVVGCVAANLSDPMKNVQAVIDGVRELKSSNVDLSITLLLVGGGNVSAPDLTVVSVGNVVTQSEMAHLYSAMDVLVSLSLAESFSLAIAEASSCAVPVICLNSGGMPEIVENGKTGIVIDHANELSGALEKIFNNFDLLGSMSVEGRKLALKKFDQDLVAQRYMDVYREAGWS
jgi:glycosyltransferase involved in cell wall biosynthesis